MGHGLKKIITNPRPHSVSKKQVSVKNANELNLGPGEDQIVVEGGEGEVRHHVAVSVDS